MLAVSCLSVINSSRVVHGPGANTLLVEAKAHNLTIVASERLKILARFSAPKFASFIKRACYNFVTVRAIKRDSVNNIFMSFERD